MDSGVLSVLFVLNGQKTNGINAEPSRFLDDPTTLHRMAILALNHAHEAANARDTEGVPLGGALAGLLRNSVKLNKLGP